MLEKAGCQVRAVAPRGGCWDPAGSLGSHPHCLSLTTFQDQRWLLILLQLWVGGVSKSFSVSLAVGPS